LGLMSGAGAAGAEGMYPLGDVSARVGNEVNISRARCVGGGIAKEVAVGVCERQQDGKGRASIDQHTGKMRPLQQQATGPPSSDDNGQAEGAQGGANKSVDVEGRVVGVAAAEGGTACTSTAPGRDCNNASRLAAGSANKATPAAARQADSGAGDTQVLPSTGEGAAAGVGGGGWGVTGGGEGQSSAGGRGSATQQPAVKRLSVSAVKRQRICIRGPGSQH
jgi:hypothetical protein